MVVSEDGSREVLYVIQEQESKGEVSEMETKTTSEAPQAQSSWSSCAMQLNRAPGLQQGRGAGVPLTPSGARGHVQAA